MRFNLLDRIKKLFSPALLLVASNISAIEIPPECVSSNMRIQDLKFYNDQIPGYVTIPEDGTRDLRYNAIPAPNNPDYTDPTIWVSTFKPSRWFRFEGASGMKIWDGNPSVAVGQQLPYPLNSTETTYGGFESYGCGADYQVGAKIDTTYPASDNTLLDIPFKQASVNQCYSNSTFYNPELAAIGDIYNPWNIFLHGKCHNEPIFPTFILTASEKMVQVRKCVKFNEVFYIYRLGRTESKSRYCTQKFDRIYMPIPVMVPRDNTSDLVIQYNPDSSTNFLYTFSAGTVVKYFGNPNGVGVASSTVKNVGGWKIFVDSNGSLIFQHNSTLLHNYKFYPKSGVVDIGANTTIDSPDNKNLVFETIGSWKIGVENKAFVIRDTQNANEQNYYKFYPKNNLTFTNEYFKFQAPYPGCYNTPLSRVYQCPPGVLPESRALLSGGKIPAGSPALISGYMVNPYDNDIASYSYGLPDGTSSPYWWRQGIPAPAGCQNTTTPGYFQCNAGVLPTSYSLKNGAILPAGTAVMISAYRLDAYDAVGPSYLINNISYWFRSYAP